MTCMANLWVESRPIKSLAIDGKNSSRRKLKTNPRVVGGLGSLPEHQREFSTYSGARWIYSATYPITGSFRCHQYPLSRTSTSTKFSTPLTVLSKCSLTRREDTSGAPARLHLPYQIRPWEIRLPRVWPRGKACTTNAGELKPSMKDT